MPHAPIAVTLPDSECTFAVPNELMVCVCVFVPVISGAGVFLHLHSVLATSCVCDCSVPHSMAAVWFLAGWYAHWGLVHPQQVGNNCVFILDGYR